MATTSAAVRVFGRESLAATVSGNDNEPVSANEDQASIDLWERVLVRIAKKIGPHSFETWFRPIRVEGVDPTALRLSVPNGQFRNWLADNYSDILQEAVRQTVGADLELIVSVAPTAARGNPPPADCIENHDEGAGSGTAPLRVIRACALEMPADDRKWLIEKLWTTQAVGIVGGSPKCLKSFLTLEMAVSVASDTPCLATFPVSQPGPVLLYAAEDSLSEVRLRLESLACHHKRSLDQLDIKVIDADSLLLDRPGDQDRLAATVRLHHPALLILDPLVRLHTADENVAGQMAALLGYLRALQRQTGVAVLITHL